MGRNIYGVCGLTEQQSNDQIFEDPAQVTHELPCSEKGDNVIQIKCGRFHSLAVSKRGNIYTWGEGSNCRLGLGFVEKTQSTPNQLTPYQVENVFDSNKVVTVGCGEFMSGLAMQSGTVYTWGKGEHEKPKFNDYLEYSSPFVILEEKQVIHLAFGRSHVMALDSHGQLYGWGDGAFGCLGCGDNKRKALPQALSFFNDHSRKVIDVACGDMFTCVIVVTQEKVAQDPEQQEIIAKQRQSVEVVPLRAPLCGQVEIPKSLREKVRTVM